jgi:hypothetical protein
MNEPYTLLSVTPGVGMWWNVTYYGAKHIVKARVYAAEEVGAREAAHALVAKAKSEYERKQVYNERM